MSEDIICAVDTHRRTMKLIHIHKIDRIERGWLRIAASWANTNIYIEKNVWLKMDKSENSD